MSAERIGSGPILYWSEDVGMEWDVINSQLLVWREQAAILMLLRGFKLEEIAKALGKDKDYIERLLREAAVTFQTEYGDDNG